MNKPMRSWCPELNTWDPESALEFYARTLGCAILVIPTCPTAVQYWIAIKDDRPVGGIFGLTDPDYSGIPSHWMTYMTVEDIAQAAACNRLCRRRNHPPVDKDTTQSADSLSSPMHPVPRIGLIEPDPGHALSDLASTH